MHDLSFFLLKNLLPVGGLAILFFGTGLLLAKFIWGRFQKRLNNAVEENMNLASQWSALGASQQDLFKKLRVRWQSDRDAFEVVLGEKEELIARLGEQLKAAGAGLAANPTTSGEAVAAQLRVRELEVSLAAEKAEVAKLREAIERDEMPVLPFAVLPENQAPSSEARAEELTARVRDLEQVLIDTREEMDVVRADYEKQVKLVESLESRLVPAPAAVEESSSPELAQITALLHQRSREAKSSRARSLVRIHEARAALESALESARVDYEGRRAALMADALKEKGEMEARFSQAAEERESSFAATRAGLESDLAEAGLAAEEWTAAFRRLEEALAGRESELAEAGLAAEERRADLQRLEEALTARESELAEAGLAAEERMAELQRLEEALTARESELAGARHQLEEFELLRRRRASLQASLNDAHHELYDVRRALNVRIEALGNLEARLGEMGEVDAHNAALLRDLEETRGQLNAALQSLASAEVARNQSLSSLAEIEASLAEERAGAAAVAIQLNDTRRDLSEVRIALSAKSEECQRALAQMEELEAIIGDRSAEVNDLSAELRQQRDLVRQLKNTLAENEGELEALNEESRSLNAGAKARAAFAEENQARIAALELALSERYRELNQVRVNAEELSRKARHEESRANQLESELNRRVGEFDASFVRVVTAEEALEAANRRIAALSGQLEKAEISLGELNDELLGLSREKEETLRGLDQASRRVTELEEAARKREVQLVEIERELSEAQTLSSHLEQKIERLEVELASAREERRLSSAAVSELEESLRASDERVLQMSSRLDEKEATVAMLSEELEKLQSLVDERAAGEAEARARIAALEAEIESRLAELRRDHEVIDENHAFEIALQDEEIEKLRSELSTRALAPTAEIDGLRGQLDGESALRIAEIDRLRNELVAEKARLEEEIARSVASQDEMEALREKLAARSESIRELQNQVSAVMMQRDSRDCELSALKDKLRAMEEAARNAPPVLDGMAFPKPSMPQVDPVALEVAGQTLVAEPPEEGGISLDALVSPQPEVLSAAVVEVSPESFSPWAGNDEDLTVFFNESASVPSQAEVEKIDRCARSIRRLGRRVEVTVIGYAGAEGSSDFNETVSARRADAVRERLLELGVSQTVVKVRGAGQDRRFSDWKARRVEMVVSPVAVAETVN
jgi:chromosome segregation ATPase